jgi:hypothetical protein
MTRRGWKCKVRVYMLVRPSLPMPPTKSKERVSNVHEVKNNKTQLLFMSHNNVQHEHTFCKKEYTYFHGVLYLFLSQLNLVHSKLELGYIHLLAQLFCTTYTKPKSYFG